MGSSKIGQINLSRQFGQFNAHAQTALATHVALSSANHSQPRTSIRSSQPTMNSARLTNSSSYRLKSNMAVIFLSLSAALLAVKILVWYVKRSRRQVDNNYVVDRGVHAAQRDALNFKGLNCENLEQFPIIKYSADSGDGDLEQGTKGSSACAVCLTEFHQNENLRVLPQCNHYFHPQCIDTWLSSHITCPLCRTSLVHVQKDSTCTKQSEEKQQVAEVSTPAAREDPQEAAIEHNLEEERGMERAGERKNVLIECRTVVFLGKSVQELEMENSIIDGRSFINENESDGCSCSRWANKLRRSQSMESLEVSPRGLWRSSTCLSLKESSHNQQVVLFKSLQESFEIFTPDTPTDVVRICRR